MKAAGSEAIAYVRQIMSRGFFSTAFQPVVHTSTGKTIGFESLLRGPEQSLLASPGRLFNEEGFIPDELRMTVDKAAINSAIRTARCLPDDSRIFINVLSRTLLDIIDNIEDFINLLKEIGVAPDRIVFEISETAKRQCGDSLAGHLKTLRLHGISIALDDIGVRSPYLYHLLCMEPEFMKIDRAFVTDIDKHTRKQKLVSCMVQMAECMGAQLIAEGIERMGEHEVLRSIGVPFSQGYFFGMPLPAEQWSMPRTSYGDYGAYSSYEA